jgi:predicted AlkP superfamily pyrophosphatase or phosphodiesterase
MPPKVIRLVTIGARRRFALMALLLALTALLPATGHRSHPAAAQGQRPNIILIVTDDQRADFLKYMPTVRTRLAANGVTFTNAFAETPACCPSRASILTGQYTHNHEV